MGLYNGKGRDCQSTIVRICYAAGYDVAERARRDTGEAVVKGLMVMMQESD